MTQDRQSVDRSRRYRVRAAVAHAFDKAAVAMGGGAIVGIAFRLELPPWQVLVLVAAVAVMAVVRYFVLGFAPEGYE